jgi:hypothetical protein
MGKLDLDKLSRSATMLLVRRGLRMLREARSLAGLHEDREFALLFG